MPRAIIEETITSERASKEKNAEIRRVMIERIGYGRYVQDLGGCIVHEDATGRLWRLGTRRRHRQDDDLAVVEVVNGSKEPDGTHKTYFLAVPPACKTATEAVAWTYGLSAEDYKSLVVRT